MITMHSKRLFSRILIASALVTTLSVLTMLSSNDSYSVIARALSLKAGKLRRIGNREIFAQMVEVDVNWVKQRQALLEAAAAGNVTNAHQVPRKVTRVLIVAQMRSGSTLLGKLFDRVLNNSLYWFEPVDAFYASRYGIKPLGLPTFQMNYFVEDNRTATYVRNQQQKYRQLHQQHHEQKYQPYQNETDEPPVYPSVVTRNLNADEVAALTDFLVNLYTCGFRRLPFETFVHIFLSQSTFMFPTFVCMQQAQVYDKYKYQCMLNIALYCGSNNHYLRPKIALAEQRHCAEIIEYFRKRAPSTLTDQIIAELNSTVPEDFLDKSNDNADINKAVSNRKSRVGSTKLAKSSSLPVNESARLFFNRFKCLGQLNSTYYQRCIRPSEVKCHNEASLIVAKAIRVRFSEIEQLIKRIPDIHVIHLFRDPRAIVLSRVDLGVAILQPDPPFFIKANDSSRLSESAVAAMIAESKHLCRRMSADLRARRRLEIQYPGAISTVRYEDLMANPERKISELFNRIGIAEPDEKYYKWLRSLTFGSRKDVGVNRLSATATAEKWKHRLSYQQAVAISRYCHRVVAELGYNL